MLDDILHLQGIRKSFGRSRLRALDDISLTIQAGEFIAIQGTSGSGKSTLLNVIAGLERADEGVVQVCGSTPQTLAEWTLLRAKTIGIVFQSFHLIPTLTARENIELPMFGRVKSKTKRRKISLDLVERMGLSHRINHLPAELSGGERQRVAIARSLVNNPQILLADEPTGNLDSKTATDILTLLQKINHEEKMAIVLVTHDRDIAGLADRTLTMRDGKLLSKDEE